MVLTVFILCAIMMFGAMCNTTKTRMEHFYQFMWILTGILGMLGAMYLRHLGW